MTAQTNSQGLDGKPTGIIPRLEKQASHIQFVQNNPTLDVVMFPVTHAHRFVKQGVTAEALTDADIITTSTISDEQLADFAWTEERDIIQSFNPRYHIPTDYPVYADMESETRQSNVQALMDGTKWMFEQLENDRTEIIPLVKGYTPEEREVCFETIDSLGLDYISFYGSQYFGGINGRAIKQLVTDVRSIISEYNPTGLLLIGLQTKHALARFPPEVVATAGQRWIEESGLRDNSTDEAQTNFVEWATDLETKLSRGISTLGSFQYEEVTA